MRVKRYPFVYFFYVSEKYQKIEAWYGQYLYVKELPEYKKSQWEERYTDSDLGYSISILEIYIDKKGNVHPWVDSYELTNYFYIGPIAELKKYDTYKHHKFDHNRDNQQNFKNLNSLTKDC